MEKTAKEKLTLIKTDPAEYQPTHQTFEQSFELIKQSNLRFIKKMFLVDLMKFGKQSEIDFIPIFFELPKEIQECYFEMFFLYDYDLTRESEFDFTRSMTRFYKNRKARESGKQPLKVLKQQK